jgi:hypothetical protein
VPTPQDISIAPLLEVGVEMPERVGSLKPKANSGDAEGQDKHLPLVRHSTIYRREQKLNTTTSANKKRRWNSILLALSLAFLITGAGSMISQEASTAPQASQQTSIYTDGDGTSLGFLTNLLTASKAYADDECDGIGPQPNLDCPETPTPTPTATPDPRH